MRSLLERFRHRKVRCRSPSEHPTAQAKDLARGDAFLPRRQRPAKVAPRRDYPTRAATAAGARSRRSAAPGRGISTSSAGKAGGCSSPSAPGGDFGGCPRPQVWVHGGDEGQHLLFATCCRYFFHETQRFWSLQISGCLGGMRSRSWPWQGA